MSPGGKYVAKDLYEVGGVPVVIKSLLDGGYINGDCMTVTGKTIAIVFPVTVMQSPLIYPPSKRDLMTTGTPPTS